MSITQLEAFAIICMLMLAVVGIAFDTLFSDIMCLLLALTAVILAVIDVVVVGEKNLLLGVLDMILMTVGFFKISDFTDEITKKLKRKKKK